MYLFKLQNELVQIENVFVVGSVKAPPGFPAVPESPEMYLFELQNVFVLGLVQYWSKSSQNID